MQVLKFGGTSVATATNISRVMDIVCRAERKDKVILVCSAISGCTDKLLDIAAGAIHWRDRVLEIEESHRAIITRLFTGIQRDEAMDECLDIIGQISLRPEAVETFGEILSTRIIARKLACEGVPTVWLDSRELVVKDDPGTTYANIRNAVSENDGARIFVAPGFVARDSAGRLTTLGRGGSDYSASLFAAATKADDLQIWTDVPGIMTANPKEVPQAGTIPTISYRSAWRLAEHGAKVLYPPAVEPAQEAGIQIRIMNTFDPENNGTVVTDYQSEKGWMGITRKGGDVFIIFAGGINSSSAHSRISSVLDRNCIPFGTISFEEGVIRIPVPENMQKNALRCLHREFFELEPLGTRLVFIAGYGAVGKALVKMIGDTAGTIAHNSGKTLRIAGISNSRKYILNTGGIEPSEVGEALEKGSDASGDGFFKAIIAAAPRRAVFVDCTDSETIHNNYIGLLEAGVSIVSSNRRSISVPYAQYAAMKLAALHSGCFLRYETTVGAALPILESIALSANSSDEITSIEAVVSCTLNYILSSEEGFSQTLKKAQSVGLTEKDPRTDLGGRDAMRKLLILAREAGVHLEESDVQIEPVLDASFFEGSIDDFYAKLQQNEPRFGRNLRFVASLTRDSGSPLGYRAGIRLQAVSEDHPAYWLRGTDNAIIMRSAFHPSPLVIQGAGEGPRQAASSILNDILK